MNQQLYSEKLSKILNKQQYLNHASVVRWLYRNGIEVTVSRLTTETQNVIDRYASVVGKDKVLSSSAVKTINKTSTFTMKLALLNESLYDAHLMASEDVEVVYAEDLLRVGDTITTKYRDHVLTYKIEDEPKTYYNTCYTAILKALTQQGELHV